MVIAMVLESRPVMQDIIAQKPLPRRHLEAARQRFGLDQSEQPVGRRAGLGVRQTTFLFRAV